MPSVFFDHASIDAWIAEDAPHLDLTTHLLDIGQRNACMRLVLRSQATAACTEEAARMVQHCGGQVLELLPSGSAAAPGSVLLHAAGQAQALLRAWKVAQNLLEYACGVAAATARMVQAVQAVAPEVAVLTTRKHPPGLRRIALKATLSAGAFPHRLGVGETLLVFPQHRALLGDAAAQSGDGGNGGDGSDGGHWQALGQRLAQRKAWLSEKKCVIEAHTLQEALQAAAIGAEVVQLDKATPEQLQAWCPLLRQQYPALRLLAAGGIRPDNAAAYAASGVDALVTSSLHYAPPADIGVQITPL
ncbi:MAG: ModD protein [Comamonadaceae bacterium]|nr:ModD protein [Comamonadaceae bacterium]